MPVCKYPDKLDNILGYTEKVLHKYVQGHQYPGLSKEDMKKFLLFILRDNELIIDSSKENFIDLLLKIDSLSEEEYDRSAPPEESEIRSIFDELFVAINNPMDMVKLITNNMKFSLKNTQLNEAKNFLKDITKKCTLEIALANKPVSTPKPKKTVMFSQQNMIEKNDKILSKTRVRSRAEKEPGAEAKENISELKKKRSRLK